MSKRVVKVKSTKKVLSTHDKVLKTLNYKEVIERVAEVKRVSKGNPVELKPQKLSTEKCEQKCKSGCYHCHSKSFKKFTGSWILSTIDDFNNATMIKFEEVKDPVIGSSPFKASWYHGLQNLIREPNDNDKLNQQNPTTVPNRLTCDIEIIGPNSIRFLNQLPLLSVDNLRSTFTIQTYDNNVAYTVLWSNWDGVGDDVKYGYVETFMQYRRLEQEPKIQLNRLLSDTDWNLPVNLFQYLKEYYLLMGQPEKAEELHSHNWVGIQKYEELYQTLLHKGIVREAKSSISYRGDRTQDHKVGGEFIGVWKTKFPQEFPLTTIHTEEPHNFTPFSTLNIDGFKGPFAVLNGTKIVAAYPPSGLTSNNPYPWVSKDSVEYFVNIHYDSSNIVEDYNPNLHGRAVITAKHGPIYPNIGYREFMAVLYEFIVSAFGPGTHMRLRAWVNPNDFYKVPETFSQLKTLMSNGSSTTGQLSLVTFRTRNSMSKSQQLYWGPSNTGIPIVFPAFNINDPFGLGFAEFDPKFAYDIDYENYLDKEKTYNMFARVVGSVETQNPITSQLVDIGYPTNGSKVEWIANKFGVFPGSDFFMYAAADIRSNADPVEYANAQHSFFGGIIKSDLTDCQTVAYIRIASEDSPDAPLYELNTRSLVFGNPLLSTKASSIWTDAFASLLSKLNEFTPDRIILDIRNNAGGFAQASSGIAALFGTDRPALSSKIAYSGDGNASLININPAVTQTFYNSAAGEKELLNANEVASVYPKSAVRSNGKRIDLIILDSTGAGSGGDVFPHEFIGADPKSTVHDIGGNVFMRIIGDIDGVLYSGVKLYDAPPINNLSPQFVAVNGVARTPFYMSTEAGLVVFDRHGSLVNPQPWTRPNSLLGMWYDQTEWVDIGLTVPIQERPLSDVKPNAIYKDQATWTDTPLEHAITD